MLKKAILCLIVYSIFGACSLVFAGVPSEISYNGRLKEYNQPVTGSRTMIFSIYTTLTGGTAVWSSGSVSVNVSNGIFSANLAPAIDWRGKDYYVEVNISGKILSPREKITSQAYTLHSRTAEDIEKSSGEAIHFSIGSSTYVVVNQSTMTVLNDLKVSGYIKADTGVVFPDGNFQNSAGVSSAGEAANNTNVLINADADGNGSGAIQMEIDLAEKMTISNSGNVGIGTNAPEAILHIATAGTTSQILQEVSNSAYGPTVVSRKARNTYLSPQVPVPDDVLYQVKIEPYLNSAYRDIGEAIKVTAEDNPSGNYLPTRLQLCTSSSTANATPKVTVTSAGRVGIGTTTPSDDLEVSGGITSGYGFFHDSGDTSALDVDLTGTTLNNTWTTKSLRPLIPPGTKAVVLYVEVKNANENRWLVVRKMGNSNERNVNTIITQIPDQPISHTFICPVNANGEIEYKSGPNGTWAYAYMCVIGWFK